MIGVDLFAGAGGMSLGAQDAGIEIRLAVEIDRHAAATYHHNHPNTKVLERDVRIIAERDLPKTSDYKVLFGGPPCQGFSTSNQRTRNSSNTNNWLFTEFIRIAELWEPDWIVFENVKGILETAQGMFVKEIKSGLKGLGYKLSDWILDASEYGVPQKRHRYFLVASKSGLFIMKPTPTVEKPITVGEAIDDLPILSNGAMKETLPYRTKAVSEYARSLRNGHQYSLNNLVTRNSPLVIERYKHIPQGGNWLNIPMDLMENYSDPSRCHTGIYHRLLSDNESVVLGNYRKNMLIHPNQNRGLSVREAARIQSFPDWYEFLGTIGFQQQQVSNAVPARLAEMVFKTLLDCT